MTSKPGPDWLAALQARFGGVIRTPLDRTTGTLRASVDAYDPEMLHEAIDGPRARCAERLAVYNRQYWFRLFGVMQTAFPTTTRLLGHWRFNAYAAGFLSARPPRHWDLDRAPDGFESYFAHAIAEHVDRDALCEAAEIDAAWRGIFRAPATRPFSPSASDSARILRSRLDANPATAIVVEHWPLLALRGTLAEVCGEAPAPLPPRLARPQWWVLLRETAGIRHVALDAREGELLRLLREHTVAEALARLEAACTEAERATLPERTERWLSRSVERGLWRGFVDDVTAARS